MDKPMESLSVQMKSRWDGASSGVERSSHGLTTRSTIEISRPRTNWKRLWRITCFVVDKNYRKSGVASTALKAALESIGHKGGGLVEAIPVSKTDQGPGY